MGLEHNSTSACWIDLLLFWRNMLTIIRNYDDPMTVLRLCYAPLVGLTVPTAAEIGLDLYKQENKSKQLELFSYINY